MGVFIGDAGGWFVNLLVMLGSLMSGPSIVEPEFKKIEPEFQRLTGKSLEKVSIAIHCIPAEGVTLDDKNACDHIARCLGIRLKSEKLRVVDQDTVAKWMKEHPETPNTAELGMAVKADFLICIEMEEFTLHGANKKEDFQCSFVGQVSVHEIGRRRVGEKVHAKLIYMHEQRSRFPQESAIAANIYPEETFRKLTLSAVSSDLKNLFCPHYVREE